MTDFTQKLLEIANREIGCVEVPRASNNGACVRKYQDFYGSGMRGQPWCAIFVWYCVKNAADAVGIDAPIAKSALASDYANSQKQSLLIDSTPQIGAIFFQQPAVAVDANGNKIGDGSGHVGIVESLNLATGQITTIEGNAGDAVKRRVRSFADVKNMKFLHTDAVGQFIVATGVETPAENKAPATTDTGKINPYLVSDLA